MLLFIVRGSLDSRNVWGESLREDECGVVTIKVGCSLNMPNDLMATGSESSKSSM